jgi:osmoprotectant transport system ATP-binding protein
VSALAPPTTVVRVEGLTLALRTGAAVVEDVGFSLQAGEILGLVGESGSGKTTTALALLGYTRPGVVWRSGTVEVGGEQIGGRDERSLRTLRGRVVSYVPQDPGGALNPSLRVGDAILDVLRAHRSGEGSPESVHAALDRVELGGDAGFTRRYPHQLSGGQQQRVGVARALAADPPVLLMDEPFGAIDPIARERLQNEFLRLQGEVRKTIVFVTHDIDEAVKLGDRMAVLRQGGVLQQYDSPAEILAHPANEFVADFVGADRGLKRLRVTAIDAASLEKPPVVALDAPLADARRSMDADGARWAIVIDAAEHLHGYLSRERAEGDGTVADRARRMDAWVSVDSSLKDALSEMLLHDAGWVAVLDGDRYLGVLTPDSLYGALRQSVGAEEPPG